jgi:NAD-dependent dihydropyrimidine dehydrogenase PreA subunit
VWREDTGKASGTTKASSAFRYTGQPPQKLYKEALQIGRRFRTAGGLFGAWVGLVLGLKLIALSVKRRRFEYEADRAACVACGRCYPYCPEEHVRLKALEEIMAKEAVT